MKILNKLRESKLENILKNQKVEIIVNKLSE